MSLLPARDVSNLRLVHLESSGDIPVACPNHVTSLQFSVSSLFLIWVDFVEICVHYSVGTALVGKLLLSSRNVYLLKSLLTPILFCFVLFRCESMPLKGIIVRQRAAAITQWSRTATGVLVQKLDKSDRIKDVALVPEMSDEIREANAGRGPPSRREGGGFGGAAGVAENLRGGGGRGKRRIKALQARPAWMSFVVPDDKDQASQ